MPPNPTPRRQTLDYATHWQHDIFYVLRGTVYNSGPHPVRVTPSDVRFHSGAHPLTGQEVAMPQRAHPRQPTYLLYPGQFALIEIVAWQMAIDWLDAANKGLDGSHVAMLIFQPGDCDDPTTVAKVTTTGKPVQRCRADQDGWAVLDPNSYWTVSVDYQRSYPTSLDMVVAQLTDDEDEIANIALRDEMRRLLRQEQGPQIRWPTAEIVQLNRLRQRRTDEQPATSDPPD